MAVPVLNPTTVTRALDVVTASSNVTSDGGAVITARGFNYGLTNQVLQQQAVAGTTGAMTFDFTLAPGRWYFQAFATNADGTTVSEVVSVEVYGETADVRADQGVASVIAAQEAAGYYFVGTGISAKSSNILLVFSQTPGASSDARLMGSTGRWRVTGGETATGVIYGVKAIGSGFAYGDGCVAILGEPPLEDDTVEDGAVDLWPASSILVKSGECWIYGSNIVVT
jgi:hypothetical protein